MSYVVLARKWRPQSFADLVGQEHVATTLGNSIAQDRVAHAFLFTGVRGVGKTTSARILAKALQCEKGPTATPCLACGPCVDIAIGADMDVIEMDAASNRGINEVRDLQQTLAYRPARDRFKIYIVDEVHMLTPEAWNAFLKTLEEPPPHVKFIFATTEVHKVPVTILSRCQRYDFKLISATQIAGRIRYILGEEKIEAEDTAIKLVAREAAGSMRDAMSLLDQVIAWAGPGEKISGDGAARVLGVADRSVLHRLARALVRADAAAAVDVVAELSESGYDVPHVARDFLAHLRDLVVAKVAPDGRGLADVPEEEKADLVALASEATVEDLARLHLGLARAFDEIARGASPRASLEMTLVRLARRPALVPVDELLRRLSELERRIDAGGGGGGGAASGGGATSSGEGGPRGAPARSTSRETARGAAPDPGGAADRAEPPSEESGPPPLSAFDDPELPPSIAPTPRANVAAPPSPPQPAPATPPPPVAALLPRPSPPIAAPSSASAPRPVTAPPVIAPSGPGSIRRPGTLEVVTDVRVFGDDHVELVAFREIVTLVHGDNPGIASVLEHAALVEATALRLVVGFEQGSFLASQLQDARTREMLRDVARARLGDGAEVDVVSVPREALAGTLAKRASEVMRERIAQAEQQVKDHPVVASAIELLGAELREVRLAPDLATAASWERRGG